MYHCICFVVTFQDWQLGGRCEVFVWGSGRQGQLAETGRGTATPNLVTSFSSAQQVSSSHLLSRPVDFKSYNLTMTRIDGYIWTLKM